MADEKIKVYLYSRVSTEIQVDGYSLEAQDNKMNTFCQLNEYEVAGKYEDAGKSGKSILDRPSFLRMIDDIKTGKDGVKYVIVFKLSRFGRNAADILSALQETLNQAVVEVIRKLVRNPRFTKVIKKQINIEIDTKSVDEEIKILEKQLRQYFNNRDSILDDLDNLDIEDKHYNRRKQDLDNRLYKNYDKIEDVEDLLLEARSKKKAMLEEKTTGDNIFKSLLYFDEYYEQMSDREKREFMCVLIKKGELDVLQRRF